MNGAIPPPRHERAATRVRVERHVRTLRGPDGVIGFGLLARPLSKHYATSVWRDEDARGLRRCRAAP